MYTERIIDRKERTPQTTHDPQQLTLMELDEFEEVIGEFQGCEIDEQNLIVRIGIELSIMLSRSANLELNQLKGGERVHIIRTEDDLHPIRIRALDR